MKQSLGKTLSGIFGKSKKDRPEVATVPDSELRFRLGIRSGDKVCLFHAPKYLLPLLLSGDLKLTLDWVESDSDVILYWLQSQDDAADITINLERMIKRGGRIWLIIPEGEAALRGGFTASRDDVKRVVLEATSLVDNKILLLSNGECGIQFMPRKAAREEALMEDGTP